MPHASCVKASGKHVRREGQTSEREVGVWGGGQPITPRKQERERERKREKERERERKREKERERERI